MKLKWVGLGVAVVAMTGCGGAAFVRPVPTEVSLEASSTAGLELIISRNSLGPDSADVCTLTSTREWCSQSINRLRFDVQPSFTLYRAYVRNTGTETRLVRVRVFRRDRTWSAFAEVRPGQTRWYWELGVQTVEVKDATQER